MYLTPNLKNSIRTRVSKLRKRQPRAKNTSTRFDRVQPLDNQCSQESDDENQVSQGINDIALKNSPTDNVIR